MITEPVPVSPHDTPEPADHTNPRELLAWIHRRPFGLSAFQQVSTLIGAVGDCTW